MRVGWLADKHDPPGGAELTQAEFRAAAPEGVEVVDCPPGGVVEGLDRYVVHNHQTYSTLDFERIHYDHATRYHHDLRGPVNFDGNNIYCSPLQRGDQPKHRPFLVPPALCFPCFRPSRQIRRNGHREGTVSIAAWMNPGKGDLLLAEWAKENGPVDCYGFGPHRPKGKNINDCGPLDAIKVPGTLWHYERFVFLPTALEPFGRSVVEAWLAGCELVINNLVGARYWIEEEPEKLESAASDFWEVVLA